MTAAAMLRQLLSAVTSHPLLERLLIASLELVVVTAVVLAIIHVARIRSNRVVAVLWLIALAKPVVGLLVGTPAPVWNAASLNPTVTTESVVIAGTSTESLGYDTAPFTAPPGTLSDVAPRSSFDVAKMAKGIWLAGALLMLLLSVADRLRIRKLIAAATAPPPEILATYERVAGPSRGRRPPRLLITDRLESPAIVGTLSPVVLLPAWMTRRRDRDRVLWSLRHELTHWRHRDHLACFVTEMSRILFFFHPLVWWIGRRWKVATEIACDQSMVATRGDARRYAEQLYQILARVHSRRQIMLANGLFATRTQIGKRIELLLKSRPHGGARRKVPAVVFLLVFGALVLALGAELSPQADPGKVVVKSGGGDDEKVFTTVHKSDEDGYRTVVTIKGKVEFNAEHTDVVSISDDGSVEIEDVRDGVERELKIEPSSDGALKYEYEVDGEAHPFDDEAREWLAQLLESTYVDGDRLVVGTIKPKVILSKGVVIGDSDDSYVTLRIVDPDRRINISSDDDMGAAIDVYVETDDDDQKVWISTSTDVVHSSGDRVVINITDSGKVSITVKKDGDKHELEMRAGSGGEKEFIYKLNGEVRPYDDDAKNIFEKYQGILEDGIELHVEGERI